MGSVDSCDAVGAGTSTPLTTGTKGTIGRGSKDEDPWVWMYHHILHTVPCETCHPTVLDTYRDLYTEKWGLNALCGQEKFISLDHSTAEPHMKFPMLEKRCPLGTIMSPNLFMRSFSI